MSLDEDTIAATITAPGRAAIACVRVSGPETRAVLRKLVQRAVLVEKSPRTLIYSSIKDLLGEQEAVLDYALVSYFPAPRSFTGEETLEFQLHGSPYVQQRLFENLFALGVRQAEPGEFSKRAFLNGQMDLSQVEGVADLIAAETHAQAEVAKQQLSGRLSEALHTLGEPLRDLLAEIEAYIDFPEEDIDPMNQAGWAKALNPVLESMQRYVRSYHTGKVYREGARVVLAGIPNAGKSSLLNALSGEARAIVTPIAGTTRDSIEVRLDIAGLAVSLWDTAGLLDAVGERDEVERLGIERSWKLLEHSDLVLFVFTPDANIAEQLKFFARVAKRSRRIQAVLNKQDLVDVGKFRRSAAEIADSTGEEPLLLSAQNHSGIEVLLEQIRKKTIGSESVSASLLICNRRHFEALSLAAESLERASALLQREAVEPEFVSLELRSALSSLQEIVGVTHTEDILGRIFSKFCIGK